MPPRACLAAACFAASIALSGGRPAFADTLPPLSIAQQDSLGHALRLWTAGLIGGSAQGYTVTPADGHYDLQAPIAGPIGSGRARAEGAPITATTFQDPDGRWHLDDIALPSPLRITVPTSDGARIIVTQTLGSQTANVLIDPTLKAQTLGDTVEGDLRLHIEGGKTPFHLSAARANTHVEWAPASPGRVDMGALTRYDDVVAAPDKPDADTATFHVKTVLMTTQLAAGDPDRLAGLLQHMIALGDDLPAPAPGSSTGPQGKSAKPTLTPAQRGAIHRMLDTIGDLFKGFRQSISAEQIAVDANGEHVTLASASLSQSSENVDGKLDIKERLEVSDLGLPADLPLGSARDLVPHHLIFAPHISGVLQQDMLALLGKLIDNPEADPKTLAPDATTMLAKSPISGGLDELSFDLGPAALHASGQVTVAGPDQVNGHADVDVQGLDALMKRAQGDAMLKQALPVLLFLKGLGEQQGERMVWKIVYDGSHVTVNGNDMSGMIPGH